MIPPQFGVLNVSAPPARTLAKTGSGSAAISITLLEALATGDPDAIAYVDTPIGSSKVYWEVVISCGILCVGLTNNLAGTLLYGGYATTNVGVYTAPGSGVWNWGVVTGDVDLAGVVGKVYGFAFDGSTKTLSVYQDNSLEQVVSFGAQAGPFYAHCGFQGGFPIGGQSCSGTQSKATFQLGVGNTTYAAPSGYGYL